MDIGEPPWISEMYGYMFGAAEQGVDTTLTQGVAAGRFKHDA